MKPSDILYQTDHHYIIRNPRAKGFLIFRHEGVAAVRCGIVGYEGDKGLQWAIREIARREQD